METLKVVREVHSRSDSVFPIIPIGDIHRGSAGVCEHKLYQAIEKAKELDAVVVGMGDYGECITKGDTRHDTSNFDFKYLTPDKQYRQTKKDFEGVNPVAILQGNHEDKLWMRHGENNWGNWLATELGARYCPDFLYLRIVVNRKSGGGTLAKHAFNILAHHGYSSGRTPGSAVKTIHDMANVVAGDNSPDAFLMGHRHVLGEAFPQSHLWVDRGLRQRQFIQHFYYTGSYVKSYEPEKGIVSIDAFSSYAAKLGMPPTDLGCPIIWVKQNRTEKGHDGTVLPAYSVRYNTLDWEMPSDLGE